MNVRSGSDDVKLSPSPMPPDEHRPETLAAAEREDAGIPAPGPEDAKTGEEGEAAQGLKRAAQKIREGISALNDKIEDALLKE